MARPLNLLPELMGRPAQPQPFFFSAGDGITVDDDDDGKGASDGSRSLQVPQTPVDGLPPNNFRAQQPPLTTPQSEKYLQFTLTN